MLTSLRLKLGLLALIILSVGCGHLRPVNDEVRTGGSVLVDVGDSTGAEMVALPDLTAELILAEDANSTVFNPQIVRLFRAFPDPISIAGRNYSVATTISPDVPWNDGKWFAVVQLVDSGGVPLSFTGINLPSEATLEIKENGASGFTSNITILPDTASPNTNWDGSDMGDGHPLSVIPHVLIDVSGAENKDFAGAKFVVQYDSTIWSNQFDSVLIQTGQSMISVNTAVVDPNINLSFNEEDVAGTNLKELTILFSNPNGFQPLQQASAGSYVYVEDGKSLERDISSVILSWFKTQGCLTNANLGTYMTLITAEFYDVNGDEITGPTVTLDPRFADSTSSSCP